MLFYFSWIHVLIYLFVVPDTHVKYFHLVYRIVWLFCLNCLYLVGSRTLLLNHSQILHAHNASFANTLNTHTPPTFGRVDSEKTHDRPRDRIPNLVQ